MACNHFIIEIKYHQYTQEMTNDPNKNLGYSKIYISHSDTTFFITVDWLPFLSSLLVILTLNPLYLNF